MITMSYKMLDLKLICFLIIGIQSSFYAQKTLKNFEGNLMFKESNYYTPITRKVYDTVNIYYSYEVAKTINIERCSIFDVYNIDSEGKAFLPIIFFQNGDSIFLSIKKNLAQFLILLSQNYFL